MFPSSYFADRYFAPTYWPDIADDEPPGFGLRGRDSPPFARCCCDRFSDDFEDSSASEAQWSQQAGTWAFSDGVVTTTSSLGVLRYTDTSLPKLRKAGVWLKTTADEDELELRLKKNASAEVLTIQLTFRDSPDSGRICVYDGTSAAGDPLAARSFTLRPDTSYVLRVCWEGPGTDLKVFVDGGGVLQTGTPFDGSPDWDFIELATGTITGTATFDNVRVAAQDGSCECPRCIDLCPLGGDDFNRDDSTDLGDHWTEDAGALSISSGKLTTTDANAKATMPVGLTARAEVTTIQAVADSGGRLDGTHLWLYGANNGKAYYVWNDVDSGGNDPVVGDNGVAVSISSDDTAGTIASAWQAAIDALDEFSATVSSNTVTVTNNAKGPATSARDGNTGFAIETVQEGLGDTDAKVEVVVSSDTSGDVAGVLLANEDGEISADVEFGTGTLRLLEDGTEIAGCSVSAPVDSSGTLQLCIVEGSAFATWTPLGGEDRSVGEPLAVARTVTEAGVYTGALTGTATWDDFAADRISTEPDCPCDWKCPGCAGDAPPCLELTITGLTGSGCPSSGTCTYYLPLADGCTVGECLWRCLDVGVLLHKIPGGDDYFLDVINDVNTVPTVYFRKKLGATQPKCSEWSELDIPFFASGLTVGSTVCADGPCQPSSSSTAAVTARTEACDEDCCEYPKPFSQPDEITLTIAGTVSRAEKWEMIVHSDSPASWVFNAANDDPLYILQVDEDGGTPPPTPPANRTLIQVLYPSGADSETIAGLIIDALNAEDDFSASDGGALGGTPSRHKVIVENAAPGFACDARLFSPAGGGVGSVLQQGTLCDDCESLAGSYVLAKYEGELPAGLCALFGDDCLGIYYAPLETCDWAAVWVSFGANVRVYLEAADNPDRGTGSGDPDDIECYSNMAASFVSDDVTCDACPFEGIDPYAGEAASTVFCDGDPTNNQDTDFGVISCDWTAATFTVSL